ncbi:MAG TPA: hypothetical protein PLM79_00245 [Syntrophobacteraceae bacterium]|nr:hypothetical protein [Syntrophobacteraceae bacterium]
MINESRPTGPPATKRHCGAVLWMLLCFLPAGCAPKVVQIPPEWAQAPQPAPAPPKGETTTPFPGSSGLSGPPPATTAILKPPPAIKEKDLSTPSEPVPPPREKKQEPHPPQHLASMHLVDQAKGSLKQKKPDSAIPLLEQAIQVDVHNGEAFLNLARAWRMKGFRSKALEFAKKAEILFQEEPAKLKEAYLLEAELYKEMGDSRKTDLYRQKAAKISSP